MTAGEIIGAANTATGIRCDSSAREKARARHLATALLRELIEPTPPHRELARLFGRRDHGTSMYAVRNGQRHPRYPALLEMFRKEAV